MCGRFTLRTPAGEIAKAFGLMAVPELPYRYNIAPTQSVAAVRQSPGGREFALLRWGLVPSWADDPKIGNRLINARADTVATKPSFRSAFKSRRCLVVADGFYEWRTTGKQKQPFHIRMKGGHPFALAGLWERWDRGEQSIESCALITTDANDLMRPIHDRMPVIISPDEYDVWLTDAKRASDLLRPYPPGEMEAFPVSTIVNSARNETPECVEGVG